MENKMRCPVCRCELVEYKMLPLQTADEHIMGCENPSLKMAYCCPNTKNCACTFADGKPVVYWNEDGELYGNAMGLPAIDNNNAPFGSFQRKINVEVYKKDENKLILALPFCFPSVLSGMNIFTHWHYKANEEGEILQRRLRFDYITKYGVYHNWGPHMLSYCLRHTFRDWREAKKDPHNKWTINSLKQTVRQKSWQHKEWWRKVNIFFAEKALKNLGETA